MIFHDLIKFLTPKYLRYFVNRKIKENYILKLAEIEETLPKYELSEKHIKNLKAVTNRNSLAGLLPKGGIVAELGVADGNFSQVISKQALPEKLHLIDTWDSERYSINLRRKLERTLQKEVENGRVEIHTGHSLKVGELFPDSYFDWVYIDTDHSYHTTLAELELYGKKVRKGGFIAGHDFIKGNWSGMVRYGVIESVYEFCVKYDWEIIYLTMELNSNPSFAIKEIF